MKKCLVFSIVMMVFSTASSMAQMFITRDTKGKEVILGLPNGYQVNYFIKDDKEENATYYVVLSRREPDIVGEFYLNFCLYYGHLGDQLNKIKIYNVERYRDGGTTIIESIFMWFYFPTPFKRGAVPTLTEIFPSGLIETKMLIEINQQ